MVDNKQLIAVKLINKRFTLQSNEVVIAKNLSFQVLPGEMLTIAGASGTGKSTLLQMLAGLMPPDSGSIYIGNTCLNKLSNSEKAKFRKKNMGFVFQFHYLIDELTALENVCLPLLIQNIKVSKAKFEAHKIIERVGMSQRVNHKPTELSGGERQRIAIARALVHQPKLILMDEPTGNLDQKNSLNIYNLLTSINQESQTTFITVTHDPALIDRSAKVKSLVNGQLE